MKGYELYQKLKLNISPNDLDRILYHASYQPQDDNIRKMNKDFIVYGHSVARVALAVYAYINKIFVSASEISKMIASTYIQVTDATYIE